VRPRCFLRQRRVHQPPARTAAESGIDSLPLAIAAPWGLNVGDCSATCRCPPRSCWRSCRRSTSVHGSGRDADPDQVAAHIRTRMQDTLDALAQERRLPVIGMKVAQSVWVDAPPEAVGPIIEDPSHYLHFMDGDHALGGRRKAPDRARRPLQGADARRLGRDRRHGRGRRVRPRTGACLDLGDRRRAARSLASAAASDRPPIARVSSCGSRRPWPAAIVGTVGRVRGQPAVSRHVRRSLRELRRQVEHEQERIAASRPPRRPGARVPAAR